METLGKLFGSASRVKILRLFLFHPGEVIDTERIKKRTRVTAATLRKELNLLEKTGFIERAPIPQKEEEGEPSPARRSTVKTKSAKKEKMGFRLAPDFPYTESLRSILINSETLKGEAVAKELEKTGKIKLVIVSGIFIGSGDSRVDLFVVGDKINKRNLENYLRSLEGDLGCEIAYAVMDVKEYDYRQQVRDRLIRDILDYPHEKLINRF